MKKTLIIFLFYITSLQAQVPTFEWAASMGGLSSADRGSSIAVDASGNVYTTGIFEGTVDFDPGTGVFNLTSAGNYDIFIQKLDASGNFIWAKRIGGSGYDNGLEIVVGSSGNIFCVGEFQGTVDFNPGTGTYNLTAQGGYNIFILKLTSFGDFVWAKSMKGYGHPGSVIVDASDNIYTTGSFQDTVDFNPGTGVYNLTSNGSSDIFISKLNSSGNFIWAKSMGGNGIDGSQSITLDGMGNVYISGLYEGVVDFDPGINTYNLTSNGYSDVFICKLDVNGNFLWAKSVGSSVYYDESRSLVSDVQGNLYIGGTFYGTVDFDPGVSIYNLTSNAFDDIFILKLNSSGDFVWVKSIGGGSSEHINSMALDTSGNVYATGEYSLTVDFNPNAGTYNLTSNGGYDIFILKLNSSGGFVWAKSIGGTGFDNGFSLTTDIHGNLYTTGVFSETVDFDPGIGTYGLTSNGGGDIFVSKFSQCIINTTITDNSPYLTANATNASYKWLDCDNNYTIIPGATNQTFVATANGNYAVEVTQNNCTDTSLCVNVTGVGINKLSNKNEITVYPNPSNGIFIVEQPVVASSSYIVVDLSGKIILQNTITSTREVIDLSAYSKGVYFLRVGADVFKLLKH
ncbi:T9SS type A sorting domain-containing protein [Acidiluteibacter ferrifornacis]|uniref:T9SS type A sorting domain-containing protein n=1 Tax=Acidiluteibacter ferrifornacis TaxID=2692424 RepID=A0A6N9NJQ2_9FLAO|nr:T9SS type A sorting domain-containing protein [Acidiluteibacter ferrifornacis]NBG65711.1 T9SS type A sorting domain-containing protein [Acidiluteibacter ferrifornacis]